jgi:hypothetical protein
LYDNNGALITGFEEGTPLGDLYKEIGHLYGSEAEFFEMI